jgi:hypothetical protein
MKQNIGDTYLGIAALGSLIVGIISGVAGLIGLFLGEWIGSGICLCASVIGFSMLFTGLVRN